MGSLEYFFDYSRSGDCQTIAIFIDELHCRTKPAKDFLRQGFLLFRQSFHTLKRNGFLFRIGELGSFGIGLDILE